MRTHDKRVAFSQGERPVAFMSRTLSKRECNYPTVEKEAASIIEAVRRWGHYLYSRPFTLTDQRSLAFMFDQRNRGKIKNPKIHAWRAELGMFAYEVKHRSGKENVASLCSSLQHSHLRQQVVYRRNRYPLERPAVGSARCCEPLLVQKTAQNSLF